MTTRTLSCGNNPATTASSDRKRTLLPAAAAAAALTLAGVSAHASCADLRTAVTAGSHHVVMPADTGRPGRGTPPGYGNAAAWIVGTWKVSYTVEGNPFADAFIQWHNDGTEWENINLPVLGGNICVGDWQALDQWRVSRNHIGWLYTNGTLSGYFTETEVDTLSASGNAYNGTNDQKIYDLNGNLLAEVTGTSMATRL